jgi:hypothetical protein
MSCTNGVLVGNGKRSLVASVALKANTKGILLSTEEEPTLEAIRCDGNTTDLDTTAADVRVIGGNITSQIQSSGIIIDISDELEALLQLSPLLLLEADPRFCTRAATKCSTWADRSATGYEVTQAVDGNRPVFKPRDTAYGNRATLNFNAAASTRLASVVSIATAQPHWWLIVGNSATDTSGFVDSVGYSVYAATLSTQEHLSLFAGSGVIGAGARVDAPAVFVAEFNGASSKGWVGQYTTPQVTGNPGANAAAALTVGGGVTTNYVSGAIGLMALFAGTSTTALRRYAMMLAARAYKLPIAST